MATQHRKHRGFRTERVVAQYLSTVWSGATVGRGSGKDIVNVPFDVEVKARAGFQPLAYLKQLKARTSSSGELGFGVIRLNGQGEDAREYAAIIRLEDLLPLLILKYGHLTSEPTEADIDRCTACNLSQGIRHGWHDRPVVPCISCNAPMVKGFSASAIHFKGKGFYSNDK